MKSAAVHKVDLTGDYETTIYDAARRLLAEGAGPRDEVQTFRNGQISMCGTIGWLARWAVEFRARGPVLVPHRSVGIASVAAVSASQASLARAN